MKLLILHSHVGDRGGWKPELTQYVDADGGTNPHRKYISGYVFTITGGTVLWSSKKWCVMCKQSHMAYPVIFPESLPPAKLAGFLSLIKHALPTATTCLYIIIYTILFYIKTWMTTINGCQSAKYS